MTAAQTDPLEEIIEVIPCAGCGKGIALVCVTRQDRDAVLRSPHVCSINCALAFEDDRRKVQANGRTIDKVTGEIHGTQDSA